MKSNDYPGFGENARKRVPPSVLVRNLFEHTNDKFEWIVRGVDAGFTDNLFRHTARNPIEDEITIMYEGFLADKPPPQEFEFMDVKITKYSPFNCLCLTTRKLAT
jgi:hypothetical protein